MGFAEEAFHRDTCGSMHLSCRRERKAIPRNVVQRLGAAGEFREMWVIPMGWSAVCDCCKETRAGSRSGIQSSALI